MVGITEWKLTAPFVFGTEDAATGESVQDSNPRMTRHAAIMVLLQRGFAYVGEDSLGLPCFRSRSGAMLISVGSCRCLAYAKVGARLQVIAAARTLALLCRICPEDPVQGPAKAFAPATVAEYEDTLHPESALII
jgi:hypothetical protein